tara:strand:+ start:191 stop:1123 length:933 start_codon:yes stop_codon:yes gene_type:complete
MELIEGVALSKLCDYSFGDQSGQWSNIYTSFMEEANLTNVGFVTKLFEVQEERNYMTLFIDNIRLYKRDIKEVKPEDKEYVNSLMEKSNLLELCSHFSTMNFIIFTNLEDTPIDEYVFGYIPDNVLCISAINAEAYGGKVIPAPYGLQRRMTPDDNRIDNIERIMEDIPPTTNLLYISHADSTHEERLGIKEMFADKEWASVHKEKVDHPTFMRNICEHKFMICPRGNAIDCHRNWEVLYMRRVPVMKRYKCLEVLYKDYPVLWVDKYADITEELLIKNNHLFEEAQEMDITPLTLPTFFDSIVSKALNQ